jgi:hypothetical protein
VDAAVAPVEANLTVRKGEERVVASHADVLSSVELGTALADEDGASGNDLSAETFHTQALAAAVASVPCRSLTFFMCHGGILRLFAGLDRFDFDPGAGLTMADGAVIAFPAAIFESDNFGGPIMGYHFGHDLGTGNGGLTNLDFGVLSQKENVRKLSRRTGFSAKAFNFKGLAFANLVLLASCADDGDGCHKFERVREK